MKNIFSNIYARDEKTNQQKKNLIATIVNIPVNAEIYNDDIIRNSGDRLGLGDYLIYQWSLSNGNPANFRDWAGINIDEGDITEELKNIEEEFWKNAFIEVRKKWNALYGKKDVFVKIKKYADNYYKKHYNSGYSLNTNDISKRGRYSDQEIKGIYHSFKSPEEDYYFNEKIEPIENIIRKITTPSPYSICKSGESLTDAAVKLMSSLAGYIKRLDLPLTGDPVFYPVMDLYATVASLSSKKSKSIEIGLVPNAELRDKNNNKRFDDEEADIDRRAWKKYEDLYGTEKDSGSQHKSSLVDRSAEAAEKEEKTKNPSNDEQENYKWPWEKSDSAKTGGEVTKTPEEKLKELKHGKYRFPLQPENEHLFADLENSRKTLTAAFNTLNNDLKGFSFNTFRKNIFGTLSPNDVVERLSEIVKSMADITDNFFPERIDDDPDHSDIIPSPELTVYGKNDPGWGIAGTLSRFRRNEDRVIWDKKHAESLVKNAIMDSSQIFFADENQFKENVMQQARTRHYYKQLHLANPVDFNAEDDVELQNSLQNINTLFAENKQKANDITMDYNHLLDVVMQFIDICSKIFFERWKIADGVAGDPRLTTIADPDAWHPRQGNLYDTVQDFIKQKKNSKSPGEWDKEDEDELNELTKDMNNISVVDPSDYRYDYVYYYEWMAQKHEFEIESRSSNRANDTIRRRFNEIKADLIANPEDNSEGEDFWGPVDDMLDNSEFFRNVDPESLEKEMADIEDTIKKLNDSRSMIRPLSHDQANISGVSKFKFYDILAKRRAYHILQLIKNNIDKINNIKIDGKQLPTKIILSPLEKDHKTTEDETVVTFKMIVDYILYTNSIGMQGRGNKLDPRIIKFLDDVNVEYTKDIKTVENSKDILSRKLNVVRSFFRGGSKVVVLDKSTWKTIISRMKPSARRVLVNYINHNYEKKERSAAG